MAGEATSGSPWLSSGRCWSPRNPQCHTEQVWDCSSYPAEPRREFPQRGAVTSLGAASQPGQPWVQCRCHQMPVPGVCWSLSCTSGQVLWPLLHL